MATIHGFYKTRREISAAWPVRVAARNRQRAIAITFFFFFYRSGVCVPNCHFAIAHAEAQDKEIVRLERKSLARKFVHPRGNASRGRTTTVFLRAKKEEALPR